MEIWENFTNSNISRIFPIPSNELPLGYYHNINRKKCYSAKYNNLSLKYGIITPK